MVSGASRGIGRATAVTLAAEGASVLLLGRGEQSLAQVARECDDAGGRPETLAIDIAEPDAGARVLGECLERFGRIDALVNNAGISSVRSLEQLTDADWQEHWDLNVMAPIRLMRAASPAMARQGWGRIVNVSSSSGKRPGRRNMAYSVTKAAELSLSRAFADRWASENVLVNAVTPGATASELWVGEGGLGEQIAGRGRAQEAVQEAASKIPLRRFAEPQEIADVIVFLCSARASFVTGAAWSADGGAVPVII